MSRAGHDVPLDIVRTVIVLGMVVDVAAAPPWLSLLTAGDRFTLSTGVVAGPLLALLLAGLVWRLAAEVRLALALQQTDTARRQAAIASVFERCSIDRYTALRWAHCESPHTWTHRPLP